MQPCRSILSIVVLASVLVLPTRAATAQSFFDGTFDDTDWASTIVFSDGNGGTVSASQSATGGNPGSYWGVAQTMSPGFAQIYVFHERLGFSYDPSTQGPITSIDFSIDGIRLATPFGGQTSGLGIRQAGIVYRAVPGLVASVFSWQPYSQLGLVATNFEAVNGSGTPDFSSAGTPIDLGLITSNTNPFGQPAAASGVGYDNWSVTIDSPGVPAPVPSLRSPGVALLAALLASAGSSLALRGRMVTRGGREDSDPDRPSTA